MVHAHLQLIKHSLQIDTLSFIGVQSQLLRVLLAQAPQSRDRIELCNQLLSAGSAGTKLQSM